MIEVESLTKDYGTVVAVRDLSFQVGKGEVVGFLGPNGAGKSTTLRILAGFLGATSGRATVAGYDVAEESLEARRAIGYMPEASPLYPELRVGEYLIFRSRAKQIPRSERRAAIERALDLASIKDVERTLIRHLSKGYRQRVGLADALLAKPPLLILDEPTAGLDPNQIREVRSVIRSLGAEHTILISTHILSEVEAMCDRAIVINRGMLVAQGPIDEFLRCTGAHFSVRGDASIAKKTLSSIEAVARVDVAADDSRPEGGGELRTFHARFRESADPARAVEEGVAALVARGLGVCEAKLDAASLEETFAELTLAAQPSAGARGVEAKR